MKTTFISVMALGVAVVMAGPADRALADQPMVLTDAQLDRVTAGGSLEFSLELPGSAAGRVGLSTVKFIKHYDMGSPYLNIKILATQPPAFGALPGGRDPQ